MTSHKTRAEPDNAAATQGQERRLGASGDHKQETLLLELAHSQLWKLKSGLKSVFLFWTKKR